MSSRPNIFEWRMKLASSADRALATIRRNATVQYSENADAVNDACQSLAKLIERCESSSKKDSKTNMTV